MASNSTREMFLNLAVREVKRSIAFFTQLGFAFSPELTDDQAACIIFPAVFGALLWGGLWLRDRRLQNLLPLRAQ